MAHSHHSTLAAEACTSPFLPCILAFSQCSLTLVCVPTARLHTTTQVIPIARAISRSPRWQISSLAETYWLLPSPPLSPDFSTPPVFFHLVLLHPSSFPAPHAAPLRFSANSLSLSLSHTHTHTHSLTHILVAALAGHGGRRGSRDLQRSLLLVQIPARVPCRRKYETRSHPPIPSPLPACFAIASWLQRLLIASADVFPISISLTRTRSLHTECCGDHGD